MTHLQLVELVELAAIPSPKIQDSPLQKNILMRVLFYLRVHHVSCFAMASFIGLAVAALFFGLSKTVRAAVPSPQSIGSDLTILTHNDLYGNASSRQAAVIVLSTPQSQDKARSNCAAIGETLWALGNSTKDLGFLRYLDYDKTTNERSVHWIGGSSGCRAITPEGEIQTISCGTQLPALCSQSAPLSSPADADAGPKWQTSINTGIQTITGFRDKFSFRFLGIRYTPRPARFGYSKYQPQSEPTQVSGLSYAPMCPYPTCTEPKCSEDCLFLNIWTPYLPNGGSGSNKKPVMLWIHGGGFTTGTGSDPTFDGGSLASRGDVVVVTINYRLSTLGFLALSNTTIKGNYGLSDQIAALDWVRGHIADFGGDGDRITVFGQSAGAASVRALLASPMAKGKFSGAIMMSNPGGSGYASTFSRYMTIEESTQQTKALLDEVDCQWMNKTDRSVQLACLRAQDPVKLVTSANVARLVIKRRLVDGTYLTSNELLLNRSASFQNIPVMIGVMRDDGDPFSSFSTSSSPSQALSEQGFNATAILGSNAFAVPEGNNTRYNIFNLTSRVTTDAAFRCLAQSTAVAAVKNYVFAPVYSYEFHRGYQISEWSPNPPTCEAPITAARPYGDTAQEYFKCHSGELYYVFGTLVRQGRPPRDDSDIPFSQYVVDTWTAFARNHNPNPSLDFLAARGFTNTSTAVSESGSWEPVKAEKPMVRILDKNVREEGFRELEQCAVLGYPLKYYEYYDESLEEDVVQ
ncbi:alpha/beta-hydrolase [Lindgomyces ingoldianus]|uniref:Alpha/beta-hydrolase n=1 Tax=Lindgomyces ingoldianus TaxID=673940 RepID=A0ACB6R8S9_9PLEO|nr:alpha/beta-hydrolase [Lindgomyces ingoldianus]KAF2475679.1 alpha/beta-hydrolase [Lindgomyces ingoldianus]